MIDEYLDSQRLAQNVPLKKSTKSSKKKQKIEQISKNDKFENGFQPRGKSIHAPDLC